ncbi:MAG: DUF3551 domain-containing protein [Alphaproteobacteria bacterium]|nr:DUF3551 domain-containing protein [Alphaproteobacteria bacterium]
MRSRTATLLLGVVLSFAGAIANDHAAAQQFRFGGARSGAWCLFDDPWTYNCGFATLQQCLATSSGAGGQCQPNPSGPPVEMRRHRAPRRNP